MNLSSHVSKLDSIARNSLLAILFLMPIFFIPWLGVNSATAKFILFIALTGVAFVGYSLARLGDKKLILPSRVALWSLISLPVVFLASALFGGRAFDSVFGYGFEPTTVAAITALCVFGFLASVYAREEKTVTTAKKATVVSFAIVVVYQLIRLFVGDNTLTFQNFFGPNSGLLGKWNDLAIVASIGMLASVMYMKGRSGKALYVALFAFVVSGFFLKLVSFNLVWPVLAVLFLIYAFTVLKSEGGVLSLFKAKEFSRNRHTIFVVLLAVGFMLYSFASTQAVRLNSQGALLRPNLYKIVYLVPNYFGGSPTEVRPSAMSTVKVFSSEVTRNPVFGVGPNRFIESWNKFKAPELSQSAYWNTDFAFGVGYIPTLIVTTGLLGLLAIGIFIALALKHLLGRVFRGNSTEDNVVVYATLILVIMSIAYVPAMALVVYMFAGIGYIFARSDTREFDLSTKFKKRFLAASLALTAVFVVFVGKACTDALSSWYFVKSVRAIQTEKNIDTAENYLKKALALRKSDIYYRAYSELLALKSQVVVAQNTQEGQEISQETRAAALEFYRQAESLSERAIATYPQNYSNYLFAGNIYAGDPDMLEKAVEMFTKSLEYNPNNPDAYFGIARVRATQNDIDGVKQNLEKALQIRNAYTPALLAGAEITAANKDVEGTVGLLTRAYQSDRSRVDLLIQIASLQQNVLADAKAAQETLEFAVANYPTYAEGRLALSNLYAKEGRYEDAANLLVGIQTEDKDVGEVLKTYIESLKAGKNPFPVNTAASTTTPAEKAPAKTENAATSTEE
jgi:tetratricopeptide (TPR) repeat protein